MQEAVPGQDPTKEHVRSYTIFNATTGAMATGMSGNNFYGYLDIGSQDSMQDRSGAAFNTTQRTQFVNGQAYSVNRAATIGCNGWAGDCQQMGTSVRDINADGIPDGYFAAQDLTDGTTVASSSGSQTYVVKATDITLVPGSLSVGDCSAITLGRSDVDPSTLTCGRQPANHAPGLAVPAVPSVLTYINGVEQISAN